MPMMALSLIPQHAVPVKGFMMAKMGVVYVIRNDEHVANRFKVGQTYDLEKRISELSSSIFLNHTFIFLSFYAVITMWKFCGILGSPTNQKETYKKTLQKNLTF